jgi:hypothetical protein
MLSVTYKRPLGRILFAAVLALLGFGLLVFGLTEALTEGPSALAALICGALLFIPGAYASYVYAAIARGSTAYRLQDWYAEHVEELEG